MGHPWRHHNDGTRHYAMCNHCGDVITEWKQGWGTEGVPERNHKTIRRHLEKHGVS